MADLKLPSLGEGIAKGTIINMMVKVGDTITLEQSLMEVETDKVVVEVPSDIAGTITEILVNVGDEISEDTLFMKVDDGSNIAEAKIAEPSTKSDDTSKSEEAKVIDQSIDKSTDNTNTQTTSSSDSDAQLATSRSEILETTTPAPSVNNGRFRASPLARKLARELGVAIEEVGVYCDNSRVLVADVKTFVRQRNTTRTHNVTSSPALPDFSKWGDIRKETMAGIMQATSKNMSATWSQIPHAWLQEKVDVTDLEAKRQLHKYKVKEAGGALTITSILVKVVAQALEEFPIFNASLDTRTNEIIYKEYINVGVAVDSERGLLVPVLRDANKKGLLQISKDLVSLSLKVKAKKTKPEDLEGGTFTISNLGGIGTTAIFPLVSHPQAAILGVAGSSTEAVWIEGEFVPRTMLPLTIAFDHRLINGADAARFLQHIKSLLEDWFLWGM